MRAFSLARPDWYALAVHANMHRKRQLTDKWRGPSEPCSPATPAAAAAAASAAVATAIVAALTRRNQKVIRPGGFVARLHLKSHIYWRVTNTTGKHPACALCLSPCQCSLPLQNQINTFAMHTIKRPEFLLLPTKKPLWSTSLFHARKLTSTNRPPLGATRFNYFLRL